MSNIYNSLITDFMSINTVYTRMNAHTSTPHTHKQTHVCIYIYIYIYIYTYIYRFIDGGAAHWLVGRVFAKGLGDWDSIPGRVISKTQKWFLIPICLTLSIIKYGSRVKWINPAEGVLPSPTPRWCNYWKGSLQVAFNYGRQLYIHVCVCVCVCNWINSCDKCEICYWTLNIYIYIYIYILSSTDWLFRCITTLQCS